MTIVFGFMFNDQQITFSLQNATQCIHPKECVVIPAHLRSNALVAAPGTKHLCFESLPEPPNPLTVENRDNLQVAAERSGTINH
jgi:hypothetical protein